MIIPPHAQESIRICKALRTSCENVDGVAAPRPILELPCWPLNKHGGDAIPIFGSQVSGIIDDFVGLAQVRSLTTVLDYDGLLPPSTLFFLLIRSHESVNELRNPSSIGVDARGSCPDHEINGELT